MGLLDLFKSALKGKKRGPSKAVIEGKEQALTCPKCKTPLTLDMERCPKCGTSLSVMFKKQCPECGEGNEPDAKRCAKCGYDFEIKEVYSRKTTYRCPICGYEADYYMTSCPACGTRFG
jgi:ribosomal protein L40E